jgi:hypothetical protein
MQLMIMKQLGNVTALRSLSLVSRTFNRLRIQHQKIVLPAVLANEIDGSVFEEAYWAVQAAQQEFDSSNYYSKLTDFIAEWSGSDSDSIKPKDVPVAGLVKISALHRRATALVEDFCNYSLTGPLAPSPACKNFPTISAVEFNRVARAFYRFEFYCNLYKDHPLAKDWLARGDDGDFIIRRNSYKLFDSWNAWEAEGVAYVRDYFSARLADAFANILEAASNVPLQVHIYHPCDEPDPEEEELPENHINFCDDLVPGWYDETAPSGASFLDEGVFCPSGEDEVEADVT